MTRAECRRLPELNALPAASVEAVLEECLPVRRWVSAVRDGRPYAGWPDLEATASEAARTLTDDELAAALAAHPRIGERASGDRHNAAASAREQAGVDGADVEVARALASGNAAYEDRFGRVFLIRAAGRSSAQILAELSRRLGNDDAAEREETVGQLRDIALLRLRQAVE